MKINTGVLTGKLAETKAFYTKTLGSGISFENDFYLFLHTPRQDAEISFYCQATQASRNFSTDFFKGKECISQSK